MNPIKSSFKFKPAFILVIFLWMSTGCFTVNYSFTGAPITARTINIDFFPNKASLINSSLSQSFTEALRDKFVNQTKLDLVETNGELQMSGEIVDYHTTPTAIQGNEQAALNRLTITINVRFENTLNPDESFEQRFSAFEDYDASLNFASVEGDLVNTITERLVQDIFNKAVVNW